MERNIGDEVIEKVLLYDNHIELNEKNSISVTTLIDANWKAQRKLLKDCKKKDRVNPMMRRSSTIGTGFHMIAEEALSSDENMIAQELFNIKEIDGITISGTFDLIYRGHIMDFKSGYGRKMNDDKLNKAMLQMSIYRWINQCISIKDNAFALFVSQSNNNYKSYRLKLMSLENTEAYIKSRLYSIKNQERIDCKQNVAFNPCDYCDFDEKDCKRIESEKAGGF